MANENETIAYIIAEMRDEGHTGESSCLEWVGTKMRYYADRLEAAHKREVNKLNSVIQATVSRSDAEIDRLRREIAELKRAGNAAKLRDAVIETQSAIAKCMDILNKIPECGYNALIDDVADELCDLREDHIKTALAAPPRNCDRFASAEEAWDAYAEWVDSYRARGKTEPFNEFGWLYTEAKEGGAK